MKSSRYATKAQLPLGKKRKPQIQTRQTRSSRNGGNSFGLILFVIGIFVFAAVNILQNDSFINIKNSIGNIHSINFPQSLPSLSLLYSGQSLRSNVEETKSVDETQQTINQEESKVVEEEPVLTSSEKNADISTKN